LPFIPVAKYAGRLFAVDWDEVIPPTLLFQADTAPLTVVIVEASVASNHIRRLLIVRGSNPEARGRNSREFMGM
jgi:hypothetical protein